MRTIPFMLLGMMLFGVLLVSCGEQQPNRRPLASPQPNPQPDPQAAPEPAEVVLVGNVARGQAMFESNACTDCHAATPDDWWGGPTMFGYWGSEIELDNGAVITVDERHFIESIEDPYKRVAAGLASDMPSYADRFSRQDYADMIAYVKSLGSTDAVSETPRVP